MALDPSDLLEPPYNFGECSESKITALAHCSVWEIPDKNIVITMRKRGDFVNFFIPELLFKSNNTGEKDLIKITPDYEDIDSWLGEYPLSMQTTSFGMNGCPRNTDELTNEVCFCILDMDFEGNIFIAPENDMDGFSPSADGDQIGLFSTTFSFIPNNEEEEGSPAAKIAKIES